MKKLILIFIAVALVSFNTPKNKTANAGSKPTIANVITGGQPNKLTPDSVISLLKRGNQRFYTFKSRPIDNRARIRATATSQSPMGVVLSCLDSRVPVETVFNMGIGDLFVARVAGNIGNEDIWGSLEYGTFVVGAKVIMVLGHEDCGAIKSAIDNVKMGNITALLAKIKPAVDAVHMPGERTSKNSKFVHAVMWKNIELTIQKMRKDSPTIAQLEKDKKIKIIGGIYDVASGKITFLDAMVSNRIAARL